MCHAVLQWAVERGMRVAPGTRFVLQFGSQDVREHCVRAGCSTCSSAPASS